MARVTRDTQLESRDARVRLKVSAKRYWRAINKGLALGYRKGKTGGTWYVRFYVGDRKHVLSSLGKSDDHQDANGIDVLTYVQAQGAARKFANEYVSAKVESKIYTVSDTVNDYLEDYASRGKAYNTTKITFDAHIIPKLGDRRLDGLTTKDIRKWHQELAKSPARLRSGKSKKKNTRKSDNPRARKATANRILTTLKAALNHAWREGHIESNETWRKVTPFRNVDIPKIHYLDEAECKRLINACSADFRLLVQGALYTGCRYGELTHLKCSDFDSRSGTISIADSKSGKGRHTPLTETGQLFFKRLKTGCKGIDWMFKRDDGDPWGRSHQVRPIKKASEIAKIDPPASFHALRHSYGSALAQAGVGIQVIAEALGHADTRITSRHYAHLMPSYVAETIRANLPDFGKFELDNVTELQSREKA